MSLTPTMRRCLDAIDRLTVCGVPPSYRQLADAIGVKSVSGAHRTVQLLVERGYVRTGGKARTLEVIRATSLTDHLSSLVAKHGSEVVERALAQALKRRAA